MAEVQDKLIDLKGLASVFVLIFQRVQNLLSAKLNKATNIAKTGQVLIADDSKSWSWKDLPTASTVDEATVRRIVNEQLAKTKYTINDQGHLIIETPEA